MPTHSTSETGPSDPAWFTQTQWSVVLAAKENNSNGGFEALEQLCRTYRRPIVSYLRGRGHSEPDAEDLAQEFLMRFVHKQWLEHLHHQNGKFRSFLLTFLKHFLSDEKARATALKRGGDQVFVPVDGTGAEDPEAVEIVDGLTADQLYDRQWVRTIMAQAFAKLRGDYATRGKLALFESLSELQPGEYGERRYAKIGEELGMSEQAIKNAVLSYRKRYGAAIREEIAKTVSNAAQVEEEARELMQVF